MKILVMLGWWLGLFVTISFSFIGRLFLRIADLGADLASGCYLYGETGKWKN